MGFTMQTHYLQFVEIAKDRLPKIWLVNGTITGDRVTFELGYLGDGYGANQAVLVPVGEDYPVV
jgi:hypothetical protein